jgi:hypothetical protein
VPRRRTPGRDRANVRGVDRRGRRQGLVARDEAGWSANRPSAEQVVSTTRSCTTQGSRGPRFVPRKAGRREQRPRPRPSGCEPTGRDSSARNPVRRVAGDRGGEAGYPRKSQIGARPRRAEARPVPLRAPPPVKDRLLLDQSHSVEGIGRNGHERPKRPGRPSFKYPRGYRWAGSSLVTQTRPFSAA